MKKKYWVVTTLLIVLLTAQIRTQAQKSNLRQHININREWKFLLGDHPGAEAVLYNDGIWDKLLVFKVLK